MSQGEPHQLSLPLLSPAMKEAAGGGRTLAFSLHGVDPSPQEMTRKAKASTAPHDLGPSLSEESTSSCLRSG